MAGKLIIDWSKAPVDATHCSPDGSVWYKGLSDVGYHFTVYGTTCWVSNKGEPSQKLIPRPVAIDWSKAPVDATHAYIDSANNTVWLKFNIGGGILRSTLDSAWVSCEYSDFSDEKLETNPAITAVMQNLSGNRLPLQSEHQMCCGTTCDRTAVARYIERLEVVADAAHHLERSGVLAGTPRMQNLKTALEDLKNAE